MLYREPLSRLAINQPYQQVSSSPVRYVVGNPQVSTYELDHALRTGEYPSIKQDVTIGGAVVLLGGMATLFATRAGFEAADARTTTGTVWLIILATVLGAVALFIGVLAYECIASIYREKRVEHASGNGVTIVEPDDIRWRTLKANLHHHFNDNDVWARVEKALTKQSTLTGIVKPRIDEYLAQTAQAAKILHHPEITSEDKAALKERIANRANNLHEVLIKEFKEYDQPDIEEAARKAAEDEAIAAGEEARANFLREQARQDVALNVKRVIDEMDAQL